MFLGIAAGLSLVGCGALWLHSRQPQSMDAQIRDFARELDALAPGPPSDRTRRGAARNVRGGLDRLPDQGAGPERPERPTLPADRDRGRGPGPERPFERGPGPDRRPRSG